MDSPTKQIHIKKAFLLVCHSHFKGLSPSAGDFLHSKGFSLINQYILFIYIFVPMFILIKGNKFTKHTKQKMILISQFATEIMTSKKVIGKTRAF